MQDFLNQFKRFSGVYHIVLKRKEFLEDKFCELEDIYREVPVTAVNTEEIELLKAFIKEKKDTIWLDIDIFAEYVLYQVKDVDDADERRFIYDFAKNLYESDCMGHIWAFDFDLRELCKGNYKTGRVVDKTELRQILMKK